MNSNSNSKILNFLEAQGAVALRLVCAGALWLFAAFFAHVTLISGKYFPVLCTSVAFAIGSILVCLPTLRWKSAIRYCFFLLMGLNLLVICECLPRLRFALFRALLG